MHNKNHLFYYFENIKKVIPFISFLFLSGSVFYEWLHYDFYGVDIFSLITFSEAIALFFSKLYFLFFLSISLSLLILGSDYILRDFFSKSIHLKRYNISVRQKKLWRLFLFATIPGLLIFLAFFLAPNFLPRSFINSTEYIYFRGFVLALLIYFEFYIFLSYDIPKYDSNYLKPLNATILFVIYFFLTIYYYHRSEVFENYKRMESNNMWQPEWHVIKLKNNEEIICKDSTFFIGQTQKFIFISSPTDYPDYFETRTIKMEDIEDFRVYSALHWRSIIP